MRQAVWSLLCAGVVVLFLSSFAHAQTIISSDITTNTTWTKAGSPYIVTREGGRGLLGVSLTIEPGVTVKFDSGASLWIEGYLKAIGTAEDSIVFTSSLAFPVRGAWSGILPDKITEPSDTLAYCIISYAERAFWYAGRGMLDEANPYDVKHSTFKENVIGVSGDAIFIEDCLFENNGIAVGAWATVILTSVFRNNEYGLYDAMGAVVDSCTFTGHSNAAISGYGVGTIAHTVISDNHIGIQASRPYWELSYNTISRNSIGLLLESGDDSVSFPMSWNNLSHNFLYNLKMTKSGNLPVALNWWGSTDSAEIAAKIFDGRDSAGLGLVTFMPVLSDSVITTTTTVASDNTPQIPASAALHQNYPNPFNPTTHLQFTIADLSRSSQGAERDFASLSNTPWVSLKIYNILGEEVAVLVNEVREPGSYTIEWVASNLPSGIYLARLLTGEFKETRKLLLMR